MPIFVDNEAATLSLDRMIFHVVGPGNDTLEFLPEVVDHRHFSFFVDRIKDSDSGNKYTFREHSSTKSSLETIRDDPESFIRESEELARRFDEGHPPTSQDGVFMLLHLSANAARFIALVKYDHQDVLRYATRQRDGRAEVVIQAVQSSFVKSKKALQKCAVVRLTDGELSALSVVDRSSSGNRDITQFFKNFLDVERELTTGELTDRFFSALHDTAKDHIDLMPADRRRASITTVREAMRQAGAVDTETLPGILGAIFGPVPADSPILETLSRHLRRYSIYGEAFPVEGDRLPRPAGRLIKTAEGVQIRVPPDADQTVRTSPDGRTITIRTEGIESEVETSN